MSRRHIVELVGLPGSGKTTLCQALVSEASGFEESFVGRWRRAVTASCLPRLLLPLTIVVFRRPLVLLLDSRQESQARGDP